MYIMLYEIEKIEFSLARYVSSVTETSQLGTPVYSELKFTVMIIARAIIVQYLCFVHTP